MCSKVSLWAVNVHVPTVAEVLWQEGCSKSCSWFANEVTVTCADKERS